MNPDARTVFVIGKGDTAPSLRIQATTEDDSGHDIVYPDLAGATVKFSMRLESDPSGAPTVNEVAAVLEDAANGILRWDPQAADTATPGVYVADFPTTLAGGKKVTIPNKNKIRVIVTENAS